MAKQPAKRIALTTAKPKPPGAADFKIPGSSAGKLMARLEKHRVSLQTEEKRSESGRSFSLPVEQTQPGELPLE